ncbi:MAG: BMP family ABC transporter substrate-binding protein [Clostridiales bacterium]|nr:BMP family ABC transporter substrate-binding protein [Clostridiales bacterium]
MKKRFLAVVLCLALVLSLMAGCSKKDGSSASSDESEALTAETIKIGVIYNGDENDGYNASHINGIREMKNSLGLSDDQVIEKTNIPETEETYDAAVDLAESGCNVIFSTSFGHEDFLLQAAAEYPDIQFCAVSGYQAASDELENTYNLYTRISEARYVSGVVAGLKIKEMIDAGELSPEDVKFGYVGAFPYAEVISGFTAFYLGAKSIVGDCEMEVIYTNSWGDPSLESETAAALISDGCILLSQQANTTGAPSTCEDKGVLCVGYNIDMRSVAPNTALTSPTNYWGIGYTAFIQNILDGKTNDQDQSFGLAESAVGITELGDSCADGTAQAVANTIQGITDGSIKIFDEESFTVGGKTMAELNYTVGDKDYSDYFIDGGFREGVISSTPAFDIIIDGITIL